MPVAVEPSTVPVCCLAIAGGARAAPPKPKPGVSERRPSAPCEQLFGQAASPQPALRPANPGTLLLLTPLALQTRHLHSSPLDAP